ncbi:MAG TPA: methyl-accepting chemotaxis protein [Desulfuromonadaceae bacterium]
MPVDPPTSISAVRNKMMVMPLIVAVVVGLGLSLGAGAGPLVVSAVVGTALIGSLLSVLSLKGLTAGLRAEQARVVACLQLFQDLPDIKADKDDVRAIASFNKIIIQTIEIRRKERQQLLDQVVDAEEKLKLIIHTLMTGDDKEVAQVHDAVAVMENLNSAFSSVILELEELCVRAEGQAAISGEMSATTDTIAENIHQYSSFVIQTSSSIEEMTHAIRETADNIRALSASTQQTVTSINLISDSQTTVRENAEQSASASESVRNQAQQGLRSMASTLTAMQEIATSNDESFDSINRLSRYSARVGDFLKVIQEVVEQTNLLSLNASIIAAQAGERGRAFAVVAEEVRSLAHRTSASTREIEELVRNIQKETAAVQCSVTQGKEKVKEGVKISAMANDALVTIEKSAGEASRMGANIANEITEQAVGIQRITEEAEKNLERVQQITLTTEHQQEGTSLIVKNLEQMRELAQRLNLSAQEQAEAGRIYLRSVLEDNERTRGLKKEAAFQIKIAGQAVDAVRRVEELISFNAVESRKILEGLNLLTHLIDKYRFGKRAEVDGLNYE